MNDESVTILARTLVRPVAVVVAMSQFRCKAHWRLKGSAAGGVVTGCDGCREEAEALQAIAQRRDRAPRTLSKKSRAFHAAGGGTEQFSLAAYDRLIEEAR